jgi:hypothetical protein
MADKVGLKIVDVELNEVNGGSFSVVAAKQSAKRSQSSEVGRVLEQERRLGLDGLDPFRAFERRVKKCRQDLLDFTDEAKSNNKTVVGLGASTKGNVILQYCGITEARMHEIGEVNTDKYGSFTPGSLIPIVPQDEVLASRPDYLVVLPWHFRSFFEKDARFKGFNLVFPLPELEIVTP